MSDLPSTSPWSRRASIARAIVASIAFVLLGAADARATDLRVAAAADLKFALDALVAEFRAAHPGIRVEVSYGSSGNFFAQLQNDAPFDLYFSADIAYPRKLADSGRALDGDVFLYAVGRIVIWAPVASPVDPETQGIEALLSPAVKKVAIANPRHAPYGVAAVAAMQSLGVHDRVESRLVFGENVAQTAQFVQSGAADVGIIALSLAIAPELRGTGRFWEIPLDAYPKMEQGGIILKTTKEAAAARTLRDFVLSGHGRAVLAQYGFSIPERATKP